MATSRLIQIVPGFRPNVDGIGDYAHHLATALNQTYGISGTIVVADPNWNFQVPLTYGEVRKLPEQTSESMCALIGELSNSKTWLLLHYSGYGYSKWGIPRWIANAIKKLSESMAVASVLHEVQATGPWHSTAKWLERYQIKLSENVVKSSRFSMVTREQALEYLPKGRKNCKVMPVYSTIGESQEAQKQPHLVVFGTLGRRRAVWKEWRTKIEWLVRNQNIETIFDIGAGDAGAPHFIEGIEVKIMGTLAESELVAILRQCLLGVLDYPPRILAKSSIFAAYCALGICPVICSPKEAFISADRLHPGVEYIMSSELEDASLDISKINQIQKNAYSWYQTHNIAKQAAMWAKLLISDDAL